VLHARHHHDLEKKALLLTGTRRSLLSNSLVIVVAADASLAPKAVFDLAKPEYKKIALGEPQTVSASMLGERVSFR